MTILALFGILSQIGGPQVAPGAAAPLTSWDIIHMAQHAEVRTSSPPVATTLPSIIQINAGQIATDFPNPHRWVFKPGDSTHWGTEGLSWVDSNLGWAQEDPITPPPFVDGRFQVRFSTDSPYFAPDMCCQGSAVRIWCDGKLILPPNAPIGWGPGVLIDWTATATPRKYRDYEIDFQSGAYFEGLYTGPTDGVAAPKPTGPVIAIMGDSECQQVTGDQETIPMLLAEALHCRIITHVQGGEGYGNPDPETMSNGVTFQDGTLAALNVAGAMTPPQAAIIVLGHNDGGTSNLTAYAETLIGNLRSKPGTSQIPVFVVGPIYQGDAWAASYAPIEASLSAACTAMGATFISTVGWETGTGDTANPHNDGTADNDIGPDDVHLAPLGVVHSAVMILRGIASATPNGP